MSRYFVLILFIYSTNSRAQFAPSVGMTGTTAIYKDSSVFVNWAKSCTIKRGYQDISNKSLGYTSVGDSTMVTGKADITGAVSLGDGGSAICQFQYPLINGNGFDFAVFENSFMNNFLELAFVEVSSNGVDFVRFPATSLTDTSRQVGSFDSITATQLNNLAGKYRGGYGTPFDLEELKSDTTIDINHITHIKIIDVIGCMQNAYATRDASYRKINDPWPTPFASGGFDLDAVGVIHQDNSAGLRTFSSSINSILYPNPARNLVIISNPTLSRIKITSVDGAILKDETTIFDTQEIDISELSSGVYFAKITDAKGVEVHKFLKE